MITINSFVCFYGTGALDERVLSDCTCRTCDAEWIAMAPWNTDTDLLECPYCGEADCSAEIQVKNEN